MSKFKDQNTPIDLDKQMEEARKKFEQESEPYKEPEKMPKQTPKTEAKPSEQPLVSQEQKQDAWLAKNNLNRDTWSALQNSLYPGAAPESILMVVNYCRARGLDPLKKPCHIVPMNVKDSKTGNYEWRDVIMPGIYEYRMTANKTGLFAGMSEPEFGPMIEHLGISAPEYCKITVYKFIRNEKCAFSHTEYFEEAVATTKQNKPNAMWTKRPRGQLSKTAEAGALRKAFPDELGGEMTAEEVKEVYASEPAAKASNQSIKQLNDIV
jgi:phage recombination protein Bet